MSEYADSHIHSIWEKLQHRIEIEPFNLVATVIFLIAVLHTFLSGYFNGLAHHFEIEHQKRLREEKAKGESKYFAEGKDPVSFRATLFHFLAEVEVVFAIWLIPLLAILTVWFSAQHVNYYMEHVNYTEPIFVVIIMSIASTRPVIKFAEWVAAQFAKLGGSTPMAWWFSILTVLPLLASFITEPAAMTIAAMLLAQKFYDLNPSDKFKYATIGALFVNISVGGTLTHFAAPPILMVAEPWNLDFSKMFIHFGIKAFLGILVSNLIYFFLFRGEFSQLTLTAENQRKSSAQLAMEEPVPRWIIIVHILALAFTVTNLHHPPYVIGAFLFFLGFTQATDHHQYQFSIRKPMLVGFFLASLVTHGGFQTWWLEPVISGLDELPLFIGATILTAFNDNAAITYLASLVPALNPSLAPDLTHAHHLEYAVIAGAVTGGGLTVIANAPNPAGQSILSKYFTNGVNPFGLLAGALIPTLIVGLCYWFLRWGW